MNISRRVTSNQKGPHPDLIARITSHLNTEYQRPIPKIAEQTFAELSEQIETEPRPLILDSGCGVGQSTHIIAAENPEHWVIGIDQSAHRLRKQPDNNLPNMILVRANCIDFWRLAYGAGWSLDKHYLLFPNPWPKKEHLQRRWHGHPVFPTLLNLGGDIELRTNWLIYAEEFQLALSHLECPVSDVTSYIPGAKYLTPFEKKYYESGQSLYKVTSTKP